MLDKKLLRRVMGQFATGITVVTTEYQGKKYGFTANSFTSVSLDPPLVLFCLNKDSEGCEEFKASNCFAINILSNQQGDLSNRFANSQLNPTERFEDLNTSTAQTGSPLFEDTLGWFDCKLHQYHEAGDHIIFIGEIVDMHRSELDEPILYFAGKYRFLEKN